MQHLPHEFRHLASDGRKLYGHLPGVRATSLEALAAAITRHARNFRTYSDDLPHGSCHPLAKEPKLGRVKARHSPLLGVASVLGHRRLPDRKMPPQGTLNFPEAHLSRLLSSPSPGTGFRPGAAWMPQAADAPPRCLYRFVPRQDPLQSTTDTTAQTRSSEGTRLCLTCRRSGGSQPQKKHSLRNHDLPVSQLTLVKARVSILVGIRASRFDAFVPAFCNGKAPQACDCLHIA